MAFQETSKILEQLNLPEAVLNPLAEILAQPATSVQEQTPAPDWTLTPQPLGGWVLFQEFPQQQSPLRWLEVDQKGSPQAGFRWQAGTPAKLEWMGLRLPSGSWMEIHPDQDEIPSWGRVDHVSLQGNLKPLACLPAHNYGELDTIPPLDKPAALPPGGGEVFLNAIAHLAKDQGLPMMQYRGPYPTAHLFQALTRSFHLLPDQPQAETQFSEHQLDNAFGNEMVVNPVRWQPAPFYTHQMGSGVNLFFREDGSTHTPQALWWQDTVYRPAKQGHTEMEVGQRLWAQEHPDGLRYHAGLVALGLPARVFFTFTSTGQLLEAPPQPFLPPKPGKTLPADWMKAAVFWAAMRCVTPLATSVLELETQVELRWNEGARTLCRVEDQTLWLDTSLVRQFQRLTPGAGKNPSVQDSSSQNQAPHQLALMLVSDLLECCRPIFTAKAQQKLAEKMDSDRTATQMQQLGAKAQTLAQERLAATVPGLVASIVAGDEWMEWSL